MRQLRIVGWLWMVLGVVGMLAVIVDLTRLGAGGGVFDLPLGLLLAGGSVAGWALLTGRRAGRIGVEVLSVMLLLGSVALVTPFVVATGMLDKWGSVGYVGFRGLAYVFPGYSLLVALLAGRRGNAGSSPAQSGSDPSGLT